MVKQGVKFKFTPFRVVPVLSVGTFVASATGIFPEAWVENLYSRSIFPTISHSLALLADKLPFSILDVVLPAGFAVLVFCLWRRQWWMALGVCGLFYLWFFWTWGLNYHRLPLATQLGIDAESVREEDIDRFARQTAERLNQLHSSKVFQQDSPLMADAAAVRVRLVGTAVDGKDFRFSSRLKQSLLADLWFRRAGIEGMFNPFGHEPLISSGLLPVELPFVIAHELAHVRGIAHEGDANLMAVLATLASDDPAFQYSGWLHLWLHLRNRSRDALLEAGPAADVSAIFARMRSQQIEWATDVQSAVLDLHLKTHDVPEGVRSYSRIVSLAIASQPRWERFR
jgi:hypothetical protein